jgi:hypothetical protein
MRANDRVILIVVPLLALCAGFWFLLIAPKRQEASDLQSQIDSAQSSIAAAEDRIASAEAARQDFPKNYGELVELGRAVPEDDDQATLVYDMSELGAANDLDFRRFEVKPGETTSVAPPPPPVATDADAAAQSEAQVAAVEDAGTTTSAPATEAAAALLPIGATVGPAGLPVMPYEFQYSGEFFDVSDFLADIDRTVSTKSGDPVVHGRLMTIDGFSLTADPVLGFPSVEANFAVTTYIVPPGEGISGGATPAGPAPVAEGSPTTIASTDTAAPATPTAAATPTSAP